MDAGQTVRVDLPDGDLTDRQRELLDFERTWWQFDEGRDDLIRARFGCSPDEYDAELEQVLEHPGAMHHDPLVVRRFQRRRLAPQAVVDRGHTTHDRWHDTFTQTATRRCVSVGEVHNE